MVQVYDLINANGDHLSPFAWRTLLALKHKGIEFKHTGLTFLQVGEKIPLLSKNKWDKIPLVVFDDGSVVYDSGPIAEHLEKAYPGNSLFPNGTAYSEFITNYVTSYFLPYFKVFCKPIYDSLDEENKVYFRKSREAWFQCTLEEFTKDEQVNFKQSEKLFEPFQNTLKKFKFLEGDQPTYSDYILFGIMKTCHSVAKPAFEKLFVEKEDKTLLNFYENVSNLFDGYAKSFEN